MGTQHKHAATIKAWADGAEIEYKTISGAWLPATSPKWDCSFEYRVKPSPRTVPFTVEDAPNLIGRAVKIKESERYWLIGALNDQYVYLSGQITIIAYHEFLDNFTFLDGSPCGKTVEGESEKKP